jgi:chitinase
MKCFKALPSSCFALVCLILVATLGVAAQAQTTTSTPTLPKRLIADYGYWSQTQTPPYSSAQIPYNEVTHINHAGVSFDANGNLIVPSGFIEKALLTKAHNHGVKVMLLLGGDFTGMETSAGGLAALQQNLLAFIQEYGYDGVDIDWEYPATAQDTAFFHSLMLALRSILPTPQYLISADVAPWGGTGYDFPDTQYIVDWFNIMTYDCAGPWTDSAQLNSAIYPDTNDPESYNCEPGGSVKEAIDIYTQQLQIAPSQLNIGTPFYGYIYHQANALWGYCPDQNKAQDCGGSVDYQNYGTFFKPRINAMGWRTYNDPYSLVPYMLKADGSEGFITYDDAASTFYRVWYTDWARSLGGTFIWEVDADYDGTTQDLLDAAFNASQVQTP